MIRKKIAFTIVETLIALFILTFVGILALNSFSKLSFKVDRLKFKNANLSFKHSITNLLSNPNYYNEDSGFADLSKVNFDDKFTNTSVFFEGEEKFRNLLLREFNIPLISGRYKCYILENSTSPQESDLCYVGDNGIVWGIPNTDFIGKGVIKQSNNNEGTSSYVPITLYFDISHINSKEDFEQRAIVLGVRADGAISLINTGIDCSQKAYKNSVQCNIADMFASLDTRFEK